VRQSCMTRAAPVMVAPVIEVITILMVLDLVDHQLQPCAIGPAGLRRGAKIGNTSESRRVGGLRASWRDDQICAPTRNRAQDTKACTFPAGSCAEA
jgi:hypothetical protein